LTIVPLLAAFLGTHESRVEEIGVPVAARAEMVVRMDVCS
jgi:hypothetical protein